MPAMLSQGVLNMLEAVWEAGLQKSTRVFEASSSEIFGRASAARFDEQSPMHPQTPYGKAKLLSYLAVKHYRCNNLGPSNSAQHALAVLECCTRAL